MVYVATARAKRVDMQTALFILPDGSQRIQSKRWTVEECKEAQGHRGQSEEGAGSQEKEGEKMRLSIDKLRSRSGIYIAIHRLTGLLYVGSALNLWRRLITHLSSARNGSRSRFHRALREFGSDAFDFDVIQYCPKEKLLERERFWIIFFDAASVDNLNTNKNPMAVYDSKRNEVTRERNRQAQLRRGQTTEAARKAMSDAQKERNARLKIEGTRIPMSQEQRDKIAATLRVKSIVPPARKGTKSSDETRAKQSAGSKGRKLSEEHKAKMRLIAQNRSAEHLAKIGDAHRGKEIPAEMRERIRASLTGRKLSPEQLKIRRAKLAVTKTKKLAALSEQPA